MSAEALRLEIAEFTDAHRWRWVLNDAQGAFLADHVVELHPDDPKHQTLFDLPSYLWHYAAPDKRNADERRLLEEVGAWFGGTVLGPRSERKFSRRVFRQLLSASRSLKRPNGSSSCLWRSLMFEESRSRCKASASSLKSSERQPLQPHRSVTGFGCFQFSACRRRAVH